VIPASIIKATNKEIWINYVTTALNKLNKEIYD
jgi:hypothetical protein